MKDAEKTESLFSKAITDIERYLAFPPKWDGYKAPPFSKNAVSFCTELVLNVRAYVDFINTDLSKISPCPCPDGSIDIEFSSKHKTLVFNFSNNLEEIGIFFEDKISNQNPEEVTCIHHEAPLAKYLTKFFA